MSADRTLRVLTLLTSALAVPLLIGSIIASLKAWGSWHHRNLTEFCVAFIPLGLTAAASIIGIRRRGREPSLKASCLDLAAALTYLAILIPVWVVDIGYSSAPGMGLLVGYTTALMIVNMCIHLYIFWSNAKYAIPQIWSNIFSITEHECPHCRTTFNVEPPLVRQISKKGERYNLIRGEEYLDEDATAYADVKTSEDQVGVEGVADQEVDKGKGVIKL